MLTKSLEKEAVLVQRGVTLVKGQTVSTKWNPEIQKTVENLRRMLRPGEEASIELVPHNLVLVKRGMYFSLISGDKVILERCDSIKVLDNGWIVACKYGRYNLHYKDGSEYKGIFFLKKSNAIKFANTL